MVDTAKQSKTLAKEASDRPKTRANSKVLPEVSDVENVSEICLNNEVTNIYVPDTSIFCPNIGSIKWMNYWNKVSTFAKLK